MTTKEEFYDLIDEFLIRSFFTLGKIIKSDKSSDADKIQAINALVALRTKINFVSDKEKSNGKL